ncbi:hypothetical protein SAMN05421813_11644 [Daejeonella rubra]|uniref:Fibronectin type-III domain-containing protein n=1 Tax=Daejeonella rubra TaxID=990371 RepID=A0A1G9UFT1_9SPHI|nr:hypothetical protein [Daejeonella rubra]SDM58385.1 hypothetical protein SAMN05421813_11644 [Daejeonella rubra]
MRYLSILILLCSVAWSCKKSSNTEPVKQPGKAVLLFPAQNEACTSGTIISDTQSSIEFKWNRSDNTDSYDLVLKNLETGISSTYPSAANNQLNINLSRNTPYSWYIISKSAANGTPAQSEVWKFYNAGPASIFYAPFPADGMVPLMGASVTATGGKITLDWNGSDADNDIISYNVYLGTTTSPTLLSGNLVNSVLNDVTVLSNTTYYWKVLTKDSKGNTSDSGNYQFQVN